MSVLITQQRLPRHHLHPQTAPRFAIRGVAAVMLVIEVAIHAYLAPDHLVEIPYIGVGFVVGAVLLSSVLVGILVAPRWALPWRAGAVVCVGMATLFVLSRTSGLPGFHESWTSDNSLGLISLPPELVFVVCALTVSRSRPRWR